MKTRRQHLEFAAKAIGEIKRRQAKEKISDKIPEARTEINKPINLEFITNLYLRVFDGAILAKDFGIAHKAIESLERLHFSKDLVNLAITSRKAKS